MPRINLHRTHAEGEVKELRRGRVGGALESTVMGRSPGVVHHGRLVEALLLEDFDGLLTGDGGQDGEWGRQVQALQLQVPPPDGTEGEVRRLARNETKISPTPLFPAPTSSVPWFVHHDVLLTQEALLDHPLVAQEL